MSTFKEYRDTYYDRSQRASENSRQLAFAGIALIWVFKVDNSGIESVPSELYFPAALLAVTLLFDFLQYVISTAIWGVYTWHKERSGAKADDAFNAPTSLNWPALCFFWTKHVSLVFGYFELIAYLSRRILEAK